MIPYGKLIILLLSCFSTGLALSPEIAIGDFGQRLWTTENGLPQNSIFAITQTRDGYLWLGTQAGLARFDGASFQVFNTRNSPLPHNDVFGLLEDREGNLWIGTFGGGISRFKNGSFTNFGSKEGLTDEVVRCLYTDWRGVSFTQRKMVCSAIRYLRSMKIPPETSGSERGAEDLIAALSVVTAQALGGSGVEYKMQVSGKKRVLPQNVEDNLLRITQEAMANVVKHAHAHHVEIEMIYKNLGIELRIRDDGRGLDGSPSAKFEGGFGLIGIRERVAQMRGKVEIQSKPNSGTDIIVQIPRWH